MRDVAVIGEREQGRPTGCPDEACRSKSTRASRTEARRFRERISVTIDHVIYAAPDLEHAVDEFTRKYGVAATAGGRHLGFGTRNALIGLGASAYLELVGIDAQQHVPSEQRLFALDASFAPRFVAWCARAPRPLEETVALARSAGCDLGDIATMSRTLPNGRTLAWKLTSPNAERAGGVLPFYIDWGESEHPAATLGARLWLASLTLVHPDPKGVRSILDALGEFEVGVESGAEPAVCPVLC